MTKRTNAETARLLAERIAKQVERGAGKGLEAGLRFMKSRVQETLSIPAPRIRTAHGYRATAPAKPNAPPRKVSGTLRMRVDVRMISPARGVLLVGTVYAEPLEKSIKHPHPYVKPTFDRYRAELRRFVGRGVREEFAK